MYFPKNVYSPELGIHLQHKAVDVIVGKNSGETPPCASLSTGYVFRVENSALVYYLRKAGRTGYLTTVDITRFNQEAKLSARVSSLFISPHANLVSRLAYLAAVFWGITVLVLLILAQDWWGVGVIGALMTARLINVVIIRRRSTPGWFGALEPGVHEDLLILVSQDRWIRIKGLVDELKMVVSSQWLREQRDSEGWITALATVIVYLAAALATNIEKFGKILLLCQLIGSVGLLAIANTTTSELQMYGRLKVKVGGRKAYKGRLDLVAELIRETGRDDWAVGMGMITKNK